MKLRFLVTAVMIAIAPLSVQAGDAAAGKAKAAACAGCHGSNGKAYNPDYPNLAGQNAPYLEKALNAYKSGQRTGGQASIMQGMAASLSDTDISNLAAHFSSLE
jgi:cytochrome c553